MSEYLGPSRVVHLRSCARCGADLVIGRVPASLRSQEGLLPRTPNKGPWRAFEREQRVSRRAWRSTKRFGFIPLKPDRDGLVGFLPHDCPKADWRQQEGVS